MSFKSVALATTLLALPAAVLAQGAPAALSTDPAIVQSGNYTLESSHARIVWQVVHMGLSVWYGDFAQPTGSARLDAKNPAADVVDITIPTNSVSTTNAVMDKELKAPDVFSVAKFPTIRFKSTKVTPTGPATADVTGDLTFHGVTKPVMLKVKFRAAGLNTLRKHYTVGFDATAAIKCSDFGVNKFLDHVSDEVQIAITAPFEKQ